MYLLRFWHLGARTLTSVGGPLTRLPPQPSGRHGDGTGCGEPRADTSGNANPQHHAQPEHVPRACDDHDCVHHTSSSRELAVLPPACLVTAGSSFSVVLSLEFWGGVVGAPAPDCPEPPSARARSRVSLSASRNAIMASSPSSPPAAWRASCTDAYGSREIRRAASAAVLIRRWFPFQLSTSRSASCC